MQALVLILTILLPFVSLAQGGSRSVYTSIAVNDCKTIESSENESDPEIDYYTGHCAGRDGFTVKISGGDIRYSLSLLFKGKEIEFTRIGAFHDMGSDKIEWRGFSKGNGSIAKFHSLIYRLQIASEGPDHDQTRDALFVVRLNGARSCLVGRVEKSAKMNEAARKIADDMTKPCLPLQF